jgi:hypothetical protein
MKYIVIFFYSLFSISHTVMAQEIVSINIFINDSANAFIDKVKILDGSYCKMLNRQPGKKNYLE